MTDPTAPKTNEEMTIGGMRIASDPTLAPGTGKIVDENGKTVAEFSGLASESVLLIAHEGTDRKSLSRLERLDQPDAGGREWRLVYETGSLPKPGPAAPTSFEAALEYLQTMGARRREAEPL